MIPAFTIEIFDSEPDRPDSFDEACKRAIKVDFKNKVGTVDILPHAEVFESDGELVILSETTRLVLLHLGKDNPGAGMSSRWGNHRSEEFLYRQLTGKTNIAVIAYTGGPKPPPGTVDQIGRPASFPKNKWYTYLYEIGDARDMNLELFFQNWSEDILGYPPLDLLQVWPSLPQAFDILRVGFLAAYGGGGGEWFNELPEALRKQVQSDCNKERVRAPDWWKPVLGEDLKGEKLSATTPDDKRKEMVGSLVSLFANGGRPSTNDICNALNPESGSKAGR